MWWFRQRRKFRRTSTSTMYHLTLRICSVVSGRIASPKNEVFGLLTAASPLRQACAWRRVSCNFNRDRELAQNHLERRNPRSGADARKAVRSGVDARGVRGKPDGFFRAPRGGFAVPAVGFLPKVEREGGFLAERDGGFAAAAVGTSPKVACACGRAARRRGRRTSQRTAVALAGLQ